MRFLFASIFFLAATLSLSAEDRPLCDRVVPKIGDVVALYKNSPGKPCWKPVKRVVSASDLVDDRGIYQFNLIFSDPGVRLHIDPIYVVLAAKKGETEGELLNKRISLIREEIRTYCSPFGYRKLQYTYRSMRSNSSVEGEVYTLFHSATGIRSESGILSRFHIRFRDELQACRKTDSTEELRDRFLFKERGFENISILAYLLNLSAQAAEKSVYHSFSVQLRKGRFRGDFESGGFVLESGNDYRVRVSNLTNRVNRELRKSLTFFIEN